MKYSIGKFINNIKIKNKLILTYLIVTIATISIVGTYLTTKMTDIVVNRAIDEAKNNSTIIHHRLEEVLNLTIKVSDMIYADNKLSSILTHQYKTYGEVIENYNNYPVLHDYLKYYNEFQSITIYVDNPTILSNSEILKVSDIVKVSDWYKSAINDNGKIAWRYTKDEFTNESYLSLIRCIKDSHGKQIGVLSISINPTVLKEALNTNQVNNYSNNILLDGQSIFSKSNFKINEDEILKDLPDSPNDSSFNVVKTNFNNKKSYLIFNSFKIEKTLENKFKVLIILPLDQITNQTNKVIINSIIAISVTIIFALIIILGFSKSISSRIDILRKEMHRVVNGDFYIMRKIDGNDEIGQLYQDLNIMIESIKKLIDEVYIAKIQKEQMKASQKEAEFKMLANQINPHFLYNTLETIRMKAFCNGDKEIADIVKKLGKIMRRNLEISGKMVTLQSELDLIESYLQIQSMRFEGMVDYKLNIDSSINTNSYNILPLLLQPIIENAFVHGLEEKRDKGTIIINISKNCDYLVINVNDDGVGIQPETLDKINKKINSFTDNDGKSIGMINANQRIKMHYGKNYGLFIQSELGKGTSVTLNLPVS